MAMTEAEWLSATDPRPMFVRVRKTARASHRVLRLFAAAFWHWQSHRLPTEAEQRRVRECAGLLEGWAETGTMPAGVRPQRSHGGFFSAHASQMAKAVVESPVGWGDYGPPAIAMLPGLIREVFGNPFRRVAADPAWLTSTVASLAEGIYAERAFDRLPILADALQDAGCENAEVLGHCSGPGPHVRGCWVIDLLLGKS
jgi:hypothetical protein